ncbi:cnot1 [Symbiodinium natans]|uniref:Cnot1 protein n=1 Tax=Symbiodinium natans TaxID=878477 RepID=A0A812MHA3_9DINO|nr:cnot1 [Symbiodinium natans]
MAAGRASIEGRQELSAPSPDQAQWIEEQVDQLMRKIYTSEISVEHGVATMVQYAAAADGTRKEIHMKIVDAFIADLRVAIDDYPPKMHVIAVSLTAAMLKHGLFEEREYEVWSTAVIEGMSQNPPDPQKLNFALNTLNQLMDRLMRWPMACFKLAQLVHLEQAAAPLAAYINYARLILDHLPEEVLHEKCLSEDYVNRLTMEKRLRFPPPPQLHTVTVLDGEDYGPGTLSRWIHHPGIKRDTLQRAEREPPAGPPPPPVPAGLPPPPSMGPPQNPPPPPPQQQRMAPKAKAEAPPPAQNQPPVQRNYANMTADQLLQEPETPMEIPPQSVKDTVHSIFNGLSQDNIKEKVAMFQQKVQHAHYRWLCYYTVSRRVTREANFHEIYIEFFSECTEKKYLFQQLVIMSFECLRLMMRAVDEAVNSISHRTTLKNLGAFLGRITIGRDQPLKSRSMDIKDLLLDAYENSRLTAVLPLACKILESISRSRAFKLPSPWSMGLLSLLAEIHSIPALKTNLTFEVEVLFRHLEIQVKDIAKSDLLRTKRAPAPGSCDLNSQRLHERQVPQLSRGSLECWAFDPRNLYNHPLAWF